MWYDTFFNWVEKGFGRVLLTALIAAIVTVAIVATLFKVFGPVWIFYAIGGAIAFFVIYYWNDPL